MITQKAFLWAGLVFFCVGLTSGGAQAQDYRMVWQIPQADPYHVDPLEDVHARANNRRFVTAGDFAPGAGRKFGGADTAYVGANQVIVGDFNGDGWDDIGVHWTSGEHNGKWTFSLNDKRGGFLAGQVANVGGGQTSYIGVNNAFAGDFNGDGWDDIGVQWVGGEHNGKWVISLNNKTATPSFAPGVGATVGGKTKAFTDGGTPIVGDFDGDGYDDLGTMGSSGVVDGQVLVARNMKTNSLGFEAAVRLKFGNQEKVFAGAFKQVVVCDFDGNGLSDVGVHWKSGAESGQWALALNDTGADLRMPRSVWVGGEKVTYVGENQALCGRFDGGKYAGIGVRWTGGEHVGKWVFSSNTARDKITKAPRYRVRMPVVFLNFADAPAGEQFTDATAKAQLDQVRDYFLATSHGAVDLAFRFKVVNIPHPVTWTGNAPQPVYDSAGKLINGSAFPTNENFSGYWCRFPLPGTTGGQIVFKNAQGNLAWENNANIHRNYCQVAERNMAKDALAAWESLNANELREVLAWAAASGKSPVVAYVGAGMPGGGVRNFQKAVGQGWPLSILSGTYTFTDYIYQNRGASTQAHELGHFLGLGDLYYHKSGDVCLAKTVEGHLGHYDLMGNQHSYFPGLSAPHRFRLGLADGAYIIEARGKIQTVVLEPTMNEQSMGHSMAIIHPDPTGHPNEMWLVENRRTAGSFEQLDVQGLYVYHLVTKDPSEEKPFIDLEENPLSCGAGPLRPYRWDQGSKTLKFHDGTAAGFRITQAAQGSDIRLTVTFD